MNINKERFFHATATILADLFIVLFSTGFAYLLRFNFHIPEYHFYSLIYVLPVVIAVRLAGFLIFKPYAGIIKYTSTEDARRIFVSLTPGTILFFLINFVSEQFTGKYLIPTSIVIMEYIFVMFFMTSLRLFYKILYNEIRMVGKEKLNAIIYGAGEAGLITKRTLEREASNYRVLGFLDDNIALRHSNIGGGKVFGSLSMLSKILKAHKVDLVVISILNLPLKKKRRIIDICLQHKVRVLSVPPMNRWINGELSFNQIKEVRIEDLLEREPIRLDVKEIKSQIAGTNVMVTGAAGSIGSEIVRQLMQFDPAKVICIDQAETPLFELGLELERKMEAANYELIIGDIRNKKLMKHLFRQYRPQFVYHAAAYKHVPVMENNSGEAVITNVLGTKILADLAVAFGARKFVFISTDKAVNPTNVMGASKRIAEMYVQSFDRYLKLIERSSTSFITTRFGNVLGSNGSVIPLFKKQIQAGEPLTVTHPEVTRYFMTIPEACQLVLEAGAIGKGGEIFIFDMGHSVKIIDLAKKMVRLSGLELGKDIDIVFTGLRPGEKLYEELLNEKENTLPTHHPKIMIAKVRKYEYEIINEMIESLIKVTSTHDNLRIVGAMKEIVPEFVSNNSAFEILDKIPG